MITIKNYLHAESLMQAYEINNQNRSNKIIAGMLWLRLSRQYVNTAIDLDMLELDTIEEFPTTVQIGSMVTLRQLEKSPIIQEHFPGLSESVKNIVGVQFRNLATLGGSVFSRFGFSNILTALLPLDTSVKLYKRGVISLAEFIKLPIDKDILEGITIQKNASNTSFRSLHKSSADFPIIAIGAAIVEDKLRISVGARPQKAVLREYDLKGLDNNHILAEIANSIVYGSNSRGSASYRKAMAEVLVREYIEEQL